MKKVGQFFFIFVPFIVVFGLQLLATVFSMGISALITCGLQASLGSFHFSSVTNALDSLWISENFNTGIMLVYALLSIALFGIWYYGSYGGIYLPNPKKVFHPLSFIGILMLVPGMQYLSSYIISLTATLFPHSLEVYIDLLENAGLDNSISPLMLVYSVLLAPVCEELIFRGVTLRQAEKCLPFWLANLMQAVLFGFFHMNLIQGVYAFCLGLVLGYVCERGGSIYHAILLHLLFNFWGTVLSEYFYMDDTVFSFVFWFLFAMVMTIAGILVFRTGMQKCAQKERDSQAKDPSSSSDMY